ncbi:PEP-CTERM sorting domain-containing protein [bacterium]|nr:MAG: PEP-CTERM sorting domain-containing protein [bacterium]
MSFSSAPLVDSRLSHRALVAVLLMTVAAAVQAQALPRFEIQGPVWSSSLDVAPETGTGQNMLVTYKGTDTFANFVGGIELNGFVGAKTFYNAGYTGTRATIANIEGGLAFTGHEMTSKVSQVFSGVGALTGAAAIQDHATNCTSMAGGYDPTRPYDGQSGANHTSYSAGIAYGANLWSGNIATSINATSGSFSTSTNSTFTAYYNALIGGINGATANIATSSWGSTSTTATGQRQLSAGLSTDARIIDAIVSRSNKLIVFAAGNNGDAASAILRTPGSPAGGNNALVVGASGTNNTATPSAAFNARAYFSAYGPSAALVATSGTSGTVINEAIAQRARVDILAPGQGIVGADVDAGYYSGGDGTSFATPIVAGGAALIEDAGSALGYGNVTDNRVVTAILQNSATKLAGWTNNSTVTGGVQRTTQALDFQQGAGQMNLTGAYDQLTGGTHDLTGLTGGTVQAKGWDYAELNLGGTNDYLLGDAGTGLLAGSLFTTTLRFNSGATYGTGSASGVTASQLQYQYLSNFSLQLFQLGGATPTLVAESNAAYITSEHFQFTIADTASYMLRVSYLDDVYSLNGPHANVGYGLAWSGVASPAAVPEPATFAALGLGLAALLRRRKRA